MFKTALHFAAAAACVLLAACGGGGGAAPPDGSLPPVGTAAVARQDPGSSLPADWQHGVFMQVYVRGYQDSNGDGIGDLRGLIQRLDYLQDLGVSGLWLMPVTRSQDRDHGYAVTDYRDIEPDYGTLADFDLLLQEAHARGIGVVIDHVINHSAAQHPAFVNARASLSNPYRGWYVWSGGKPAGWNIYGSDPWHDGGTGWYFAGFWDQMPDFDLTNPAVVAWHHDTLRFWLNRGVDGFRFDAVGNLVENGPSAWEKQPQNYALMRDVKAMVDGYARRFIVCEAPADPPGFAAACGSAFAFGHQHEVINAAKGSASAVRAVAEYFNSAPLGAATMLSNHDTFAGQRLFDQVGGNLAQYRLAAATYLLQPGTPFVYYGEEIGLAGAASLSGDHKLRTPMSWSGDTARAGFTTGTPFRALSGNVATHNVAAQLGDPGSLHAFYRSLIALRRAQASLARGSYESAAASGLTMSFQRRLGDERTLVVFNYGASPASVAVAGLPAHATLTPLLPTSGTSLAAGADGRAGVSLGATSFAVYRVH